MTEKTEAAHTPGPWNKHRTVTGDIAVIGKDCTLVARIARESPNGFADAALIASAPDLAAQLDEAGAIARELVEALEYSRKHVEKYGWTQGSNRDFHRDLMAPIDRALTRAKDAGLLRTAARNCGWTSKPAE